MDNWNYTNECNLPNKINGLWPEIQFEGHYSDICELWVGLEQDQQIMACGIALCGPGAENGFHILKV